MVRRTKLAMTGTFRPRVFIEYSSSSIASWGVYMGIMAAGVILSEYSP